MSGFGDAETVTPFRRMGQDLRRWTLTNLRYAADLFLPPICIHCHAPVAEHGVLCAECWQAIDFITPPVCDRMGLPLPYAFAEETPVSATALRHPPVFARARAVAHFDGVMRNLVHGMKYADRHEGAALFGRMLRSAGAELLADADLLVPVPLHRTRLWKRRFNQAAILAGRLGAETGLPIETAALRRTRRTSSQVGLTREARQDNVSAAFAIAPGMAARIAGKRIVLIDDVMTTGSTLNACAQILTDAGASAVNCLALAIVTDENLLAG